MFNGDGYLCDCHKRMGNDFWFMPTGSCLNGECPNKKLIDKRPENERAFTIDVGLAALVLLAIAVVWYWVHL